MSSNKDQDTPTQHGDLQAPTTVNAHEDQTPASGNAAPSSSNNNVTPAVPPVFGSSRPPLPTGSSFAGAMGFQIRSGGSRGGRGRGRSSIRGRGGYSGRGFAAPRGNATFGVSDAGGAVFDGFRGGNFGPGDAGRGGFNSGVGTVFGNGSGRDGRGNSGSGWSNFGHVQG
ncbi:hypothetical protein FGADI_2324 [Fusarium gaditjirri]|uniref:Uncharacterized protein n=1 Tax=Fusarium gaditjirri TaxID=282569 RepID=A0A8H4TIR0_9HYPO|nr:hypothetical protein FGADI_2324 [Fusarium gaditjirri]